ncbi:hypothetical protein DIJ64_07295 [Mycobacterium leprae]|uniref:Uncharacterized protein n=1 Tax=Mycobacterium leprae TaxID=1769 RepID=A0AAD2PSP9_MYCLR|nr:hypothetical protein [Mycobacterium leprae]AWV47944.1 hypothetical protein DIJ64_07295 [Mycobacterium leprae]OAR21268.1 hypothetical protein A8144_06960 [Mycobacterium leprae 3125609]OAX71336.1 hypothetical protein A3216_06520 [Mycobacterium leprae 7935681]
MVHLAVQGSVRELICDHQLCLGSLCHVTLSTEDVKAAACDGSLGGWIVKRARICPHDYRGFNQNPVV